MSITLIRSDFTSHSLGLASWRLLSVLLVAGCAVETLPPDPARSTEAIRAEIAAKIPPQVPNRGAWAADVHNALLHSKLGLNQANICAVLAVTEQESGFQADPAVPNLARIAKDEIFRRADAAGVPALAVRMALQLQSPSGKTYDDRLDAVRTERELSLLYEDFTDEVPLGKRLLAGLNPVRTGGPMQVAIDFAEAHAKARGYPYGPVQSIRHEVFTRRGGLYFGTAHLLAYAAPYGDQMIYRFADFNAGRWASRNAAFQQAVSLATRRSLDFDGDLVLHSASAGAAPGQTEAAVRTLAPSLGMDAATLRRELERAEGPGFETTPLWDRVFALAEQRSGRTLPRALIPRIQLHSPKITRKLTTEWFARRVDERWQRCMGRSPGAATRP